MTMPTDEQVSAAHAAFERAAARWLIELVEGWRPTWIVREDCRALPVSVDGTFSADTVAHWRFDTKAAAVFFKRDRCLRAALEAAIANETMIAHLDPQAQREPLLNQKPEAPNA